MHATTGTADPARPIVQHHRKLAKRKVAPATSRFDLVNFLTPPSANPATQLASWKAVDLDHDLFGTQLHGGDVMRFQLEHFPDKGFYQHLVSTSSASFLTEQRKVADSGCSLRGTLRNLLQIQAFTISTLFGDEPKY
jgi:hypothetical protein